MEEKKIITTKLELQAVIAAAAFVYAEQHEEMNSDYVMGVAAGIAVKIVHHFTGENRLPENMLEEARQRCRAVNDMVSQMTNDILEILNVFRGGQR